MKLLDRPTGQMNRREFQYGLALSVGALVSSAPSDAQQQPSPRLRICMLVHPDMILLDLTGPLTVFNILQSDVRLVARTKQAVTTDVGIPVLPTDDFATAANNFDMLFVPGGLKGTIDAMNDEDTLGFLRSRGEAAQYVTSVCTGSLLLAAAGLLRGYEATSHWYVRDLLSLMGALPKEDRVVVDRNRITAGGVTAGIDFGLAIAAKLVNDETAKRIQLVLEYDPQPPFNAGTPRGAGKDLADDVLRRRGALINQAKLAASRIK